MRTVPHESPTVTPEPDYDASPGACRDLEARGRRLMDRILSELRGVESLTDVIVAREDLVLLVVRAHEAPRILHELGGPAVVAGAYSMPRPTEPGHFVLAAVVVGEHVGFAWLEVGLLSGQGGVA
jgi:hypothetical protein